MDRLNHVKIVTPDPAGVDRFLREVLDVPEGWALGPPPPPPPDQPRRTLSMEEVMAFRGGDAVATGFITGSSESRQFQVFAGARPHIWGAAIGTRHLERAHERCVAQGLPCTDIQETSWGDGQIQFFFVEVGGILFEVMRVAS
ncbi:MAG TPA: VOC family protein [Acidimicrobiales bacterium]|nr:VOC family protein [Acidimicrobiales bacterium]